MKIIFSNAAVLAVSSLYLSAFAPVKTVSGHAAMTEPMSRNYFANIEGTWGSVEGVPPQYPEYTSVNQNRAGGVCGFDQNGRASGEMDLWLDSTGIPMPWESKATYNADAVIPVNTVFSAHHYGHITVSGCPMGRASTQACFDAFPLEFVQDNLTQMPPDPQHKDRGMMHALDMELSMNFKLPPGLAGEEVLLQWVYTTANSCAPVGYRTYFETQNPPDGSSSWKSNLPDCLADQPLTVLPNHLVGGPRGELFLNCAEVTVRGDSSPLPPFPAPVPPPVAPPVSVPTAPVASPVMAPTESETGSTCGGGTVGNGLCSDPSHCCSQWGFCGTIESGHCPGGEGPTPTTPVSSPVTAPTGPAPTTPTAPAPTGSGDHTASERLIAYLGNWHACPSDEQISQYTHIVVGFAVTYKWAEVKNECSETCDISTPSVCNNSPNPELISKWKGMGKKVILSFGGAGMGGSWSGDVNNCWDYCFGRETQVVNQLVDIVNRDGYDGVDIDYEYFYEDYMNGSPFTQGAEAQKFLKDVTLGLRNQMVEGSELTHAPMEPDIMPGKAYYDVLVEVADSLDFLMPQYYNGYVRSSTNFPGALAHYTNVVNGIFRGDASKVVYGFCIQDCGTFNLDGYESSDVMEKLTDAYPCNGGAFFWVANDDTNTSWSNPMKGQLELNAGVCKDPSRPVPVDPTAAPVQVAQPTAAPVQAPVAPQPTAGVSPGPPNGETPGDGDSGNGCCSQNFQTCVSYGGDSKESCESLGSTIWLENGALTQQCLAKDTACTSDIDACCPELTCDGNQWYRQCKQQVAGRRRGLRRAVRSL
jgi:hypothetical protein